jgi:ribosome-associated protein
VTASRVEAVFDVCSSEVLSDEQKRRITARLGPRVVAVAQDTRSQARNREIAVERLQSRIENALRVRKRRRATKPSKAATEKRLQAKRRQSQRKAARRPPVDE